MKVNGLFNYNEVRAIKTNEILKLHAAGKTVSQIVEELKPKYSESNYKAVLLIISRRGFSVNKQLMPRRTTLNEKYFESISSERVAYFFGLLCADGCVVKRMNRLAFTLKRTDGYLVELFRKEIESGCKVTYHKPKLGSMQTTVQIYSEKVVSDLIRLGCVERKSLTMRMPEIHKDFFWDFIRGYFDGDGWVTIATGGGRKYKRIGLIGSIPFITEFRDILLKDYKIKSCLSIGKGENYAELIISTQQSVFEVRNYMYNNSTVSMNRKKEIFYMDINLGLKYSRKTSQIKWSETVKKITRTND